jgi:uncharacterized protein (TIRG00374 family)
VKGSGSLWIRGLVTLAVLALIAYTVDLRSAAAALLQLRPGAALIVLALVAVDRAVMVWRWIILLRARGTTISTKSAAWIYLVSSFVGGFLPAGVGADVARAYSLSQRTARGSEAVASVAIDRILGLLSIVAIGAIAGFAAGREATNLPPGLMPIVTVLVGIACVGVMWADRVVTAIVPPSARSSGIGLRLMRLADAVGQYRGHRAALGSVMLLSITVQLLRILQAYLLGRGIGIETPFSYYLLFMPAGLVALLLPISISGIGAPQGIIVWLLQPAGVPAPQALALSTLIVLSGIVANLPGAWLYLQARPAPPERVH